MAFPKKGSRVIVVDHEKYRVAIGTFQDFIMLYAIKENVSGQLLKVKFKSDINRYWVEFPNITNLNLSILTRRDIETIIRRAIELNWTPNIKGKELLFEYSNWDLIPL